MDSSMRGGIGKSIGRMFGGEGLFLTKLVGLGKVVLQTQNFNEFSRRIVSRIPSGN